MSLRSEGHHPLLRQDYTVFTPPISRIFDQLREWIDSRTTGAYVYGRSRIGKTRAVRDWFPSMIKEHYGDRVTVLRCVHTQSPTTSQNQFIRALAQGACIPFKATTRGGPLETDIGNVVTDLGLRTAYRQVVLLVDEAQYLTEREFHVLCNVQNRADEARVKLTVFTIGTQQMNQSQRVFAMGGNLHLATRFLARHARFPGIASVAELRFVLRSYDESTEWPAESKQSFTAYFFPEAFKQGFRIAHCATELWGLYQELAPSALSARLEVPMEHVVSPIEWIFRTAATDDGSFVLGRQQLLKALQAVNYSDTMRSIAGSFARTDE